MSLLTEISGYLIQTVMGLYLLATLMRFLLQIAKADFYNPICQVLVRMTNPILIPLRKLVPGFGSVDLSALTLAILLQGALIFLLLSINNLTSPGLIFILLWSLLGVAGLLIKIYFFALIVMIILSWVSPTSYHPAVRLVYQMIEPPLAPIRRVLPPIGGIDFSPIFAFILINILEMVLRHLATNVGLHPVLVMGI